MRILETQTKFFCTVSKHFPLQCVPFCCFVYIYSSSLYIFPLAVYLFCLLFIPDPNPSAQYIDNKAPFCLFYLSTKQVNIFHWKTVVILAFPLICHICKSAVKSVFSAAVKLVIGDCRHNKWAASWHIVWGPESNQTVQLLLALIDAKFNSIRLSRRRGNVVPLV